MKTPQEEAETICMNELSMPEPRSFFQHVDRIAEVVAMARAEGYKIGVRARDEWSVDRDAAGARDRALEQLGINQDTLVRVNL